RLAEEVEGKSEDIKGKRKKYDLDRVVHSQSETIGQNWCELASEYIGHIVSVRSTVHAKSRWRFLERGLWGINSR
ncbi:MAG: hypothetical protein ACXVDN_25485, partial [Ktedonobacteraceae bacterium]